MRPAVLIVEDSPSTAQIARLALSEVPCEVEVAFSAASALEVLHDRLCPHVMIVDAHLPGVRAGAFLITLHDAAPGAAMVLLLDRGVITPYVQAAAQLTKPLQPRRLQAVVADLIFESGFGSDRGW